MPLAVKKKGGEGFTWVDYKSWSGDERWEIIDRVAYAMTPAPTTTHQSILRKMGSRIDRFFTGKTCVPFLAPTDVVFNESNIVQPDIFVVCDKSKITEANIQGAPDLIVEILSPGTILKDKREKKALYEKFGVREYILVYPDAEIVERFILSSGRYGAPDIFNWDEPFVSLAFPDMSVNLWEIFDKEISQGVEGGGDVGGSD